MRFLKSLYVILSCLISATCLSAADAGNQFVAYTSVAPVAAVMQRIGAGHWDVHSLVEAGKDPHTFSLTPRIAAELSSAKVYLAVGIELDPMVTTRAPKGMRIVDVVLPPEPEAGIGHNHADDANEDDPHVWLDPDGLLVTARATADAFTAIDPANKADYVAALKKFESDVTDAAARAAKILAPYKGRRFYVQHDAFTRYAAHFGLVQVAIEEHEKEPTGVRLAEVTRLMMADGSKVLFAQPGHNPRPLEVIAKPVGAKIETMDPMLPDPVDGLVQDAMLLADSFKAASSSKGVR